VTDLKKIKTDFTGSTSAVGVFKSKLQTPKKYNLPKKTEVPTTSATPRRSIRSSSNLGATPFRVGRNSFIATPQSSKKFDLKESLKKPLPYKPHKGPLQKFQDTTKLPLKKAISKNYKKATSSNNKEQRRKIVKEDQKKERNERFNQRRNLN